MEEQRKEDVMDVWNDEPLQVARFVKPLLNAG